MSEMLERTLTITDYAEAEKTNNDTMEYTYHSHTDSVVSVNGIWINWHTNADLYIHSVYFHGHSRLQLSRCEWATPPEHFQI